MKQLLADGWSATEIADALGGITRNAVVGKVHRSGLSFSSRKVTRPRIPAVRPPKVERFIRRRVEASPPAVPRRDDGEAALATPAPPLDELFVIPDPKRIPLAALTNSTCRFPIGDPLHADFCFCGHQPMGAESYCLPHFAFTHQPPRSRQ